MSEVKPPKPLAQVKFEVTFTPAMATKVFDLMSRMDLGISGGQYPVCYIYTLTTTTKVTPAYIKKMISVIKMGLKEQGVTQIHSVKHIK